MVDFYKLSYNNICFNYFECIYNSAMAEAMGGNVMKAMKKLKSLSDKCTEEGDTKNQLHLFVHHLEKEIRNQFDRKQGAS